MSNQILVWITFAIGGFTLLIFLIGRKGFVAPTKLNLRKDLRSGNKLSTQTSADLISEDPSDAAIKNLNIIFIYNGHSFDAYEVLGAPAGASLALVEKYYRDALEKKGQDREFIEAAFAAIRSSK